MPAQASNYAIRDITKGVLGVLSSRTSRAWLCWRLIAVCFSIVLDAPLPRLLVATVSPFRPPVALVRPGPVSIVVFARLKGLGYASRLARLGESPDLSRKVASARIPFSVPRMSGMMIWADVSLNTPHLDAKSARWSRPRSVLASRRFHDVSARTGPDPTHPDRRGHDAQPVFLGFHHAGCWQPRALTDSMFSFAPLIWPRNARSPSPSRAPPPTVRASTHALEAPAEPQQTRAFNRAHAPHLPRDTFGALQRGRSAYPACAPTSRSARESSRYWQPEPKRLRCVLALLGMAHTRSVAVRPTAFGGLLWCYLLRLGSTHSMCAAPRRTHRTHHSASRSGLLIPQTRLDAHHDHTLKYAE
ncbi:hypothetical protein B0H17DRAFT_1222175 [Mycena rosella]|uniref:Uncharacterized protein n=1 Tax=Mycena rosella TaxID=1033263 RepID=A0AAD7AYS8_MYCRO|nr:hypothetical protein B0H17DRAFT_1222175 [Mycena rosella]